MSGAIKTADFVVNGVAENGFKAENLPVHFELVESNAFEYGNGTSVVMDIGGNVRYFDTRYDMDLRKDGRNFKSWASRFLKGYVAKGLKVTSK